MMRFPVVSAAVSAVLAPTLVACSSTEPPADSPLTGEWVSASPNNLITWFEPGDDTR